MRPVSPTHLSLSIRSDELYALLGLNNCKESVFKNRGRGSPEQTGHSSNNCRLTVSSESYPSAYKLKWILHQVAMMSRITLNLRREAQYSDGAILSQLNPISSEEHSAYVSGFLARRRRPQDTVTLGLGSGDHTPYSRPRIVGFRLQQGDSRDAHGNLNDSMRDSDVSSQIRSNEFIELDALDSSSPRNTLSAEQIHALRSLKISSV